MNPERWKRIDEIFHAALDRRPLERAAFLLEACQGDESLRAEVEGLLACHETPSQLLDHPPADLAAELLARQETYQGTISQYRILEKIGSGGMGEVYLAEDSRLNRKVALKVLPLRFTKDKVRILRLEREAQVVSALNHPNILTIHDIGKTDSTSYIASEYIDGETLREHMRAAEMPLTKVLSIVIQVGEALDAAHRAGIIHRDVKPENIMLRKDGYVKVLDFGLAKLTEGELSSGHSEFETLPRTQTGTVIGTVRYMSPEQARGLALDVRTDIFSLGVVLYELIAGRAPFDGPTMSDILAAILERNPPPLRANGDIPEELRWIVTKALAKDRDERYQSVKDLLTDLKRIRKQLDIAEELKRSDVAPSAITATLTRSKSRFAIITIALVAIAALAFLLSTRRDPIQVSHAPFSKIKLSRLTATGSADRAAISPDGKYVAYAQESGRVQSLYLKQLSADTDIQILTLPPKASFEENLRFSWDGEYIFYLLQPADSKDWELHHIPVLGGISRKLTEDVYQPALAPDGKRLAFVRAVNDECSFITAQIDGSNPRQLRSRKLPDVYSNLTWSPDGKIIASFLETHSPSISQQIVGFFVDDGSERPLFNLKWSSEWGQDLQWLADGSGLIFIKEKEGANQIYHITYPDGELTPITNDLNNYSGISVAHDSKSMVSTQLSLYAAVWIAPSSDPDAVIQITSGSLIDDGSMGLSWTSEGNVIYSSREPGGGYQVWQIDPDGSNRKRITSGKPYKYYPISSPDGSIAYMSDGLRIWLAEGDGGNPKLLSGKKSARFPRFSPNGKWILYSTYGSEKQSLMKSFLDSTKEVSLASHPDILGAAVSPDGSQVAYVLLEPEGRHDSILKIISAEGGPPSTSVSLGKDVFPNGRIQWTPDGRGIAYIRHEADVSNIYVQPVDGSPARRLTNFAADRIAYFCWSSDGKRIAYSRGKFTSDIVLIQDALKSPPD